MKLGQVFAITVLLLVLLALDIYVFKGLKSLTAQWTADKYKWLTGVYWTLSIFLVAALIPMMRYFEVLRSQYQGVLVFFFGFFILFFLSKLSFALFHFMDDAWYFAKWSFQKMNGPKQLIGEGAPISRTRFMTQVGLGVGAFMFSSLLYGFTYGKYAFRVMRERITFGNLPKAFDGLKIVQISDAHLGSFMEDFQSVKPAIEMINTLEPDYIFFTGDLVNNSASEALPWVDVFKELKAKSGKYSIMGNHDYADYSRHFSPEEKRKDVALLHDIHAQMGFRLLLNENVALERDGEQIGLIGMENWGKGFSQYGDFKKARAGAEHYPFKILLSHDPTHWEKEVLDKADMDLTLSGHTHGMQMGVEIPSLGIKFSPVRFIYKRWGGLYHENGRYLYVNRGFGFLGMPGRVGMAPEITLIELRSAAV